MKSVFAIRPPKLSAASARQVAASLAGIRSAFEQTISGNTALKREYARASELAAQINGLESKLSSVDGTGAARLNTLQTQLVTAKRDIVRLEVKCDSDFEPHCTVLNEHGMFLASLLKPWVDGIAARWSAILAPLFTDVNGRVNMPLNESAAVQSLSAAAVVNSRGWGRSTTNLAFTFRHAIEFTEAVLAGRHPFHIPGLTDTTTAPRKAVKKAKRARSAK